MGINTTFRRVSADVLEKVKHDPALVDWFLGYADGPAAAEAAAKLGYLDQKPPSLSFDKVWEDILSVLSSARLNAAHAVLDDPTKIPFDFTEILAAVAPRPVYINAPLKDPLMNPEGAKSAVAAAMPVYQIRGAADALRIVHPDTGRDFIDREAAYTWLDQRFTAGARGARGRGARGGATQPAAQ